MTFTGKNSPTSALGNIQSFLDNTWGRSLSARFLRSDGPPWQRRARRHVSPWFSQEGETIAQLLQRLDTALGKAMAEDTVIDEVSPEIKRRRSE